MTLHPDLERVALLGWRLVPATANKKGLWSGYLDNATCNLDQIERWQHEYPLCHWKCVPQGSSVWALDVDVPSAAHKDDGVAVVREWTQQHGPLPTRPHGRSQNGGHLCVFAHSNERIRSKSGHPAPGIDPRAGRNAFTIAPSPGYRWVVAPWDVSPPVAPEWLLALVAPAPEPQKPDRPFVPTTDAARKALWRAINKVMDAGEGGRNDTLNRNAFPIARYVAAGLLSEQEASQQLYAAARQIGLPHAEIIATIQSAFRSGYRSPMEARA